MRKRLVLTVLSLVVLVTLARATTLPLFPNATDPAVGVSVDIRPAGSAPFQPVRRGVREVPYVCTALVTKAGNAQVRLDPLTVYPGQEQTRSMTNGGLTVRLIANISADGSKAETSVTVHRGGRLLTNQRASMWLQPGAAANPIQPVR
ncbi:MAG TPA: hypothetical protein VN605_08195 [Thermoanaerobaculia bacterium]|nr:hypothetical protein [Thermoanaerobaculia bacterium]